MDTMTGLRQLAERHATMSQPAPRAGDGDVWASLMPRLSPSLRPYAEARRQLGIERYGTPLQAHNGRDVLTDALQEALDLMVYMQQAIIEQTDTGSFDDFVALGRKDNKKMEYAGSGEGSAPDLLGKVFFRDLKMRATYVPFKGSNEYVQAVMGGHVLSGIIDISGIARHVRAGSLKLVVVLADKRLEEFPDVPTSGEKGLSDLNILNSIVGVAAHRDVPADRLAFLEEAFRKAAEDPDFKGLAKKMGLNAVYTNPKAAAEGVAKTRAVGVPLLKELNLFVQ